MMKTASCAVDYQMFVKLWDEQTAYHGQFDPENPSKGQCLPTALLVQDILGGYIEGCFYGKTRHFRNVVHGMTLDYTANQFTHDLPVHGFYKADRDKLLNNSDVKKRYRILRKRYEESKSSS